MGERSVKRARVVLNDGAPELQQAVERSAVSVSAAADVASLPKEEQADIVARGEREILLASKEIRNRRAKQRQTERFDALRKSADKTRRSAPQSHIR